MYAGAGSLTILPEWSVQAKSILQRQQVEKVVSHGRVQRDRRRLLTPARTTWPDTTLV